MLIVEEPETHQPNLSSRLWLPLDNAAYIFFILKFQILLMQL